MLVMKNMPYLHLEVYKMITFVSDIMVSYIISEANCAVQGEIMAAQPHSTHVRGCETSA